MYVFYYTDESTYVIFLDCMKPDITELSSYCLRYSRILNNRKACFSRNLSTDGSYSTVTLNGRVTY